MSEKVPKRISVSESQFSAALRTIILERLLQEGKNPTQENIELFEVKAKDNWIKVKDGREFPEWIFVLHDAAILSISNATNK